MIKHKSDYVSVIKDFVAYALRRFSSKVKVLRTDNGLELTEGLALKFYRESEIELQTSCRDTPQQNGVVERKHRHLLETARALSFQSNLPSQ